MCWKGTLSVAFASFRNVFVEENDGWNQRSEQRRKNRLLSLNPLDPLIFERPIQCRFVFRWKLVRELYYPSPLRVSIEIVQSFQGISRPLQKFLCQDPRGKEAGDWRLLAPCFKKIMIRRWDSQKERQL
jgi:hypothetical protein